MTSPNFLTHLDNTLNGPFSAEWKDFINLSTTKQGSETELFQVYVLSRTLSIQYPIRTQGEGLLEITMRLIKSWKSIGYILDHAELHPEHCTHITIRAIHESIITILDRYKKVHKIIDIGFSVPINPEVPEIGIRINSRTILQQEAGLIIEVLKKDIPDALAIYRKLHTAFLQIFETDKGLQNGSNNYISRHDVF